MLNTSQRNSDAICFGEFRALGECKVKLPLSRTTQDIASQISPAVIRILEHLRIEKLLQPVLHGAALASIVERLTGRDIRAYAAHLRPVCVGRARADNAERGSALERNAAVERPSTKDQPGNMEPAVR